jgi:hypothetical protein
LAVALLFRWSFDTEGGFARDRKAVSMASLVALGFESGGTATPPIRQKTYFHKPIVLIRL